MIQNPPIKQYAIHHTAVSRNRQAIQLFAVNRYHQGKWNAKSSLGWYVGYNYFIDVDGTTTNTRAVGEETIANVGHNCDVEARCDTISICLAGDFNKQLLTDAQVNALRKLIQKLQQTYPSIEATFHRDIQANRTCPGVLYTMQYHKERVLGYSAYPDPDDINKQKKIADLRRKLDNLRQALHRLQMMLKNRIV